MCGIAGIYNFQTKVDQILVEQMITAIAHRGPDGGATWLSPNESLCLGHRRLSIIDLSLDAFQPMHYLDKRYTIVFNGEIYNYLELKDNLISKGVTFQTSSDTEVLLALYHDKKEKCLADLDGMFAFAIYDAVEETLFCARDRFGEKPFYYSFRNGAFYFGSEMKALWAAGVPKTMRMEPVYNFLQYDVVRNPHKPDETFYENIYSLESSHCMTISRSGQVSKRRYWEINFSNKTKLSFEEQKTAFTELFTSSVSRRLRSDVPVGSSLSGGLDSSSIVMLIDRLKTKDQVQKTFSARFENFSKDEGQFMQYAIDAAKIEPHFTWPNEAKFVADFEKLCYHQEEPFGSASIFAQWEVMKLAKENEVTVLLDGQGADEIAAGYEHYFRKYYGQLYRENPSFYREELKAYEAYYGSPFKLSYPEKLNALYPEWFLKFKRSKISKRIRKKSFIHSHLFNEMTHLEYPYEVSYNLDKDLHFSTFTYGLHELLRYCDRNSMAFSREVRLPFLNHQLVEFLFSLPNSSKIKGGVTKYIIREAMRGIVPSEIIDRKEKVGYEPPQKKWLENKILKDRIHEYQSKLEKEKVISKNLKNIDHEVLWKILIVGQYL
jgi:asparagine synthase (glutamine-hydrolysing)